MTNKVVNINIQKLDVTQLVKIRANFNNKNCDPTNIQGAYNALLRDLLDTVIDAGYANKGTIVSPKLTL